MSRAAAIARVVSLVLWAAALAGLLAGGRYQQFLAPGLWPLLAGGLALLLLFAIAALRTALQDADGLTFAQLAQAVLLILPLVYLAGATRAGLGSEAFVQRRAGDPTLVRDAGLTPAADGSLTVLQILMHFEKLVDQPIVTEGIVYRGPEVPPGQFVAFRFLLTCCAADAIPAGLLIQWSGAADLPGDTWVRIRGRATLARVDGRDTPSIAAEQVEPVDPPANPYLSPW